MDEGWLSVGEVWNIKKIIISVFAKKVGQTEIFLVVNGKVWAVHLLKISNLINVEILVSNFCNFLFNWRSVIINVKF